MTSRLLTVCRMLLTMMCLVVELQAFDCRQLCTYGRGGNLCSCNVAHFQGKRDDPLGDVSRHVTAFDPASYCRELCTYGRGGNLCSCNVAHFNGKRDDPLGDLSRLGTAWKIDDRGLSEGFEGGGLLVDPQGGKLGRRYETSKERPTVSKGTVWNTGSRKTKDHNMEKKNSGWPPLKRPK